ncbi:family 20 glycosylhydrolase [Parapedobacter sp. SGR-10]|uniref:family 20 glycosylhydrolase n=1 Tax=Parapedobacter sp. SGR-10 TaxID=2710879 RepID=UPI001F0D204B|nr:family 20 glycosylhydrolase [Parapedobacter sp. SGR-10]
MIFRLIRLYSLAMLFMVTSVTVLMAQGSTKHADDFKIKGFHLDLRIQVMKLEALKEFALQLSKSGINTLIMEYEATFPFEKHPLIPNRYAYTKAEIADLVRYCSGLGIDVIPLQQSFGHVEYILRFPKYAKLRESNTDYSQVNPIQEALAKELFTDLFHEMAALHPSKYFHIGCDETRLLGHSPKSKAKVEKYGVGKLYGDYVKLMCDIVLDMGKIPVLWADIALKYPESLASLPKGVVFVDWNYGWELNRFGDPRKLTEAGFEIWGAPSLRSSPDNYNLTTWEKHFTNIKDFVPQARALGYTGMVMTSWSTSGVYSYVRESGSDMVDLYAVRRVYPLSGFNLLLEAYLKAIHAKEPLDIGQFVEDYTKEKYGFNKEQSNRFFTALTAVPYEIGQGKVRRKDNFSIKQLLDSVQIVEQVFDNLKPLKNEKEFEHYRLMAKTRALYVEYQYIEHLANAPDFTASQISSLLPRLEQIIAKTKSLNEQYTALNEKVFYASELAIDNELRIIKMNLLYDRLSRRR